MSTTTTVLRGGTIVDGTGETPAYTGDVHVEGTTISAVFAYEDGAAPEAPPGATVIDCAGKLVTPGWVDQHTHYDGQVTWDPYLSPSSNAGVTTCVMGNCGIGFAPARTGESDREFLLSLVEAVEDIPGAALNVGIDWSWETFPQYLDKLDTLNLAIDVAVLIGHAPVRAYVLGERASVSDRPGGPENDIITDAEIEQMAECVREAVAAGAVGFSTSRLILHRDSSGQLTPGSLAQEAEMLALGRAIAAGGGGVLEGVFDFASYDDVPMNQRDPELSSIHAKREWHWMTTLAREYGVTLSFASGLGNPIFHAMGDINEELGRSAINAQVFVRPQGRLLSFDANTNPFQYTTTWREMVASGQIDFSSDEAKRRTVAFLRLDSTRDAICNECIATVEADDRTGKILKAIMGPMGQVYRWLESYEPRPGDSVKDTAVSLGTSEYAVCFDWMANAADGSDALGCLWHPMFQVDPSNEGLRKAFDYPHAMPGVADGGAHGTILTDATANTTLLSWYCRDRTEEYGPKMTLENAVYKSTSAISHMYSLFDRGVIAAGKKADINVIDLASLKILQPEYVHDLPEQASRWVQYTEGYEMTMCSGVITFMQGQPTGALPGGLVRNPLGELVSGEKAQDPLPYLQFLSDFGSMGAGAGGDGLSSEERGVNAALAEEQTGASALARLQKAAEEQKSKL